jgi:O-antigen ligase
MAKQGRQKRARKVPLYSVLGFIAVLLLFVLLYGLPLLERLAFIEQSSDVRAALYHQVWQMILARPLTGYGGGTFEYAFPLFHHAPVNIDQVWERAHSSYLGLWADYGLVFGSLPQLLILMLFLRQIRAYVRASDPDPVVITAIGATVTVALHSLVDFSLEIQGVTLLFAAITAAGASAAGNRKSRQASE